MITFVTGKGTVIYCQIGKNIYTFIFFISCATFNKVCRMFNIMIMNQRIITDNQKIIVQGLKEIQKMNEGGK